MIRWCCIWSFQKLKFMSSNFLRLTLDDPDVEAMILDNPFKWFYQEWIQTKRDTSNSFILSSPDPEWIRTIVLYPSWPVIIVCTSRRVLSRVVFDHSRNNRNWVNIHGEYELFVRNYNEIKEQKNFRKSPINCPNSLLQALSQMRDQR